MELIELIQLRAFSVQDKHQAIETFNELSIQGPEIPSRIRLFGNQALPNDLTIFLHWNMIERVPFNRSFGVKLTVAFKCFGWISHSVWESLREKI